jgi:hypothetical protein
VRWSLKARALLDGGAMQMVGALGSNKNYASSENKWMEVMIQMLCSKFF